MVIVFTNCKDDNGALEFPEELRGVIWEYAEDNQDSSEFFMEFTAEEITFTGYFPGDCYYISKATLVEKNGEKYTVEEVYEGKVEGSSGYIKRVDNDLWVSGVRTYETKDIYRISERTKNSFTPKCEEFSINYKFFSLNLNENKPLN